MANNSYFDEFNKNYERPQVDGLIVGFSGIDPQRKSSGDGGSCDCNPSNLTDEQKAIVKQIVQDELGLIDFDACDCDPEKLSDEQKALIQNIIDNRLQELTINYDGGNLNTDDEPADDEPQPLTPVPVEPSDIDHERLSGLLGGNSDGHFHVSQDELLKLASYPEFSQIKHELLPDLLGGDESGHFHLNDNELKKLRIMIQVFFPDGDDNLIIKPVSHNDPDNPDTPSEDFDPFGGLPSGNPPAWELRMLPSDYTCYSNSSKMYYGKHPNSTDDDELLLTLVYNNSSTQYVIVRTKDLTSWTNWQFRNISSYPPPITDFYYDQANKYIFIMLSEDKCVRFKGSNSNGTVYEGRGNWNSVCYSPLLNNVLAASRNGEAVLVEGKTKKATSYTYLTVNPACAAWHPTTAVFCLTGLEGTSTSFNGKTWTLNQDTPHDLRELSYRQDLDNFVAWSGEDKTFYASPDGINWNQLSDTPIPLDNISSVHYEPSLQWYCAVGIGDGNAYFSKDLKHWIPTKLRNNSPVDVGDVIFMPSTGLYVAIPTSGTYYYTFNPSNWTN